LHVGIDDTRSPRPRHAARTQEQGAFRDCCFAVACVGGDDPEFQSVASRGHSRETGCFALLPAAKGRFGGRYCERLSGDCCQMATAPFRLPNNALAVRCDVSHSRLSGAPDGNRPPRTSPAPPRTENLNSIKALGRLARHLHYVSRGAGTHRRPPKGKPVERRGRKTTGLTARRAYDSGVAGAIASPRETGQ
jgi:hypothetical protein